MLEWTSDPDRAAELERAREALRDLLHSVAVAALPEATPDVGSDIGPSPVDLVGRPGVARCRITVLARAGRPEDPAQVLARARTALTAAGWATDEPRPLGPKLAMSARDGDAAMEVYADPDGVELHGATPELQISQVRHVRPAPVITAEAVHPGSVLCYECQGLGWCDVCEGDGWIDGKRCPLCAGEELCPICRGAGELSITSLSLQQREHYPQLRSR
ncbi:hypothetical protein GCM10027176_65720 [Actinoallomurus bryophytorum]|uniref:Uncharacterized protein n=1 Tax=Actinoallomurus bryophytorum TaxID=1490222 RepID=A0A543CGX7_9ACTN|nr:hypothetical protein [Actinoallomurus bryophytorum]TQL96349.1 hypothetical protein FB559_1875 [Actinoallomurus bryophytorum]